MNTDEIIKKRDELVRERQDLEKQIYDLRTEQNTINREVIEKRLKMKDIDMAIDKIKIMIQERKDEISRLKDLFWSVKD
uniref:Uncharacterized protein n=1 Tax=viral metagenome TaxID=1070528 RepID=A0A6M3LDK2_9ZZZZ